MATTLAELRTLVRQRADMENSGFVTDPELNAYINNSYKELYDLIVSRFEDYYYTEFAFTISSGAKQSLPADFYKLRGLDKKVSGDWITLTKLMFAERNKNQRLGQRLVYGVTDIQYRVMGQSVVFTPPDQAPGDYQMYYVPVAPTLKDAVLATGTLNGIKYTQADETVTGGLTITLTAGATAGSEVVTQAGDEVTIQIQDGVTTATQLLTALYEANLSIVSAVQITETVQSIGSVVTAGGIPRVDLDGVNGWDEYVIIDAAIKCLIKEETDVQVHLLEKNQMMSRIETMAANRDAGAPERVSDTRGSRFDWGSDGY